MALRRAIAFLTGYVPTPRLAAWVAVASLVWLLPLPSPWTFVAAAIVYVAVLGAALWDAVHLPPRESLTIARVAAEQLGSGDEERITYTVTSAWPAPTRLNLAVRLPGALGGGAVEYTTLAVPALGTVQTGTVMRGLRRGPVELGHVAVRVFGADSSG